MASDLVAAVISQEKTEVGGKVIIPTDTTSLFATENETEAHYLCAILNSQPVRRFVKSYSSAGRGFGAPSVMEHVRIAKFDQKNRIHKKLSRLSKLLHELKVKGQTTSMEILESQVDEGVSGLFGLK